MAEADKVYRVRVTMTGGTVVEGDVIEWAMRQEAMGRKSFEWTSAPNWSRKLSYFDPSNVLAVELIDPEAAEAPDPFVVVRPGDVVVVQVSPDASPVETDRSRARWHQLVGPDIEILFVPSGGLVVRRNDVEVTTDPPMGNIDTTTDPSPLDT